MSKRISACITLFLVCSVFFFTNTTQGEIKKEINNPAENTEGTILTIVTRHDVTEEEEFKERFLATPEAIALNITDIDFKYVTSNDGWKKLLEDPSKSVDIAWGGDPSLFEIMDSWGLLYHINPINDSDLFTALNNSAPYGNIYSPLKSFSDTGDLIWAADSISSYGFIVNHDFLETYNLPIPSTWEELASSIYYINENVKAIGIADAPLSSANTFIYQLILQNYGWEEGWNIITRIAANAAIYPGSIDTRESVVNGEVGIGFVIDFYGVISNRENPACEYIIPDRGSLIRGDPIALGKNVDDYEAAVAFMKFVSSPEGQATWLIPGIDRLPVNESAFHTPEGSEYTYMYELFNDTIYSISSTEPVVFNETLATLTSDVTIYHFHATIEEVHNLLRKAWGEMITCLEENIINETEFVELTEILGAPCITLDEAINIVIPDYIEALTNPWRDCARSKYNYVLTYLEEKSTTPTSNTNTISAGFVSVILALIIIKLKRKKFPFFMI